MIITGRIENADGFARDTYDRLNLLDVYGHSVAVRHNVSKIGDIIETVALLHDIVEDTPVTIAEVRVAFGGTVADAVDCLTRRDDEPYHEVYLPRVKSNPIAWIVKARGDLPHNMSRPRVTGWSEERVAGLRERYARAQAILAW